jgi:hypothetical protein
MAADPRKPDEFCLPRSKLRRAPHLGQHMNLEGPPISSGEYRLDAPLVVERKRWPSLRITLFWRGSFPRRARGPRQKFPFGREVHRQLCSLHLCRISSTARIKQTVNIDGSGACTIAPPCFPVRGRRSHRGAVAYRESRDMIPNLLSIAGFDPSGAEYARRQSRTRPARGFRRRADRCDFRGHRGRGRQDRNAGLRRDRRGGRFEARVS